MSEALYNRLKALKESRGDRLLAARRNTPGETAPGGKSRGAEQPADHRGGTPSGAPSGGQPPGSLRLPGWNLLAPGVHHRTVREPATGLLSAAGTDSSFLFPPPQERLLFFDCETTSLSGGAGNLVFLFGLGYLGARSIVLEQFFLEDFPDEPDFLWALSDRLSPDFTYVSYNGRAFDAQLLRSRFLLNGVPFPIRRQVDLLYPSRRLWRRRLDSCSLGSVEANILGIERREDLPGAEVPERYFDYLRRNDPSVLSPVFAHHLSDISSLVRLADTIDRLALGLVELPPRIFDGLGLATMLSGGVSDESRRRGIAALERLLESGAAATGPWADGITIARRLGRYYRSRGELSRVGRVWELVYRRTQSLEAGIEYAKYLEHQERRYAEALAVVESVLPAVPKGPLEGALRHRQTRLERRMASS
jgi:uncharacterized protein